MTDQHPNDTIAFRESWQCSDDLYEELREWVKVHLEEQVDTPPVDLDEIGLRRFLFEDGVISYDATHPHVEHEDVADGYVDKDIVEGVQGDS